MVMPLKLSLAALALIALIATAIFYPRTHTLPAPDYRAFVIDPDFTGSMVVPNSGDFMIWGTDGVILRSSDGIDWEHANTPTNQEIMSIAANASGDRLMAVGFNGTIMTSTDGGSNWAHVSGLDTTVNFNSIVHLPSTGRWVAVGHNATVAVSSEDPTQWQSNTSTLTDHLFSVIAVPNTDRVIFGGENGLIGVSTDGGESWSIIPAETNTPITGFYRVNELIFGLSSKGKVVMTRDAGDTWQLLASSTDVHFNDLAHDPIKNTVSIGSSAGSILHTTDNGYSWNIVSVFSDSGVNYITKLVYDTKHQRLLAFGYHGSVAQSTDGGSHWTALPSGHNETFTTVAFNPASQKIVGAGARGFKAVNNELTTSWTISQNSLEFYWREIVTADEGVMVAAGNLGKIIRSTDSGATWQYPPVTYTDENAPPSYRALRFNASTRTLFAAGPTGTIMTSADSGSSWQTNYHSPFDLGEAFADFEIASDGETAFVVEAFKGPYYSDNAGKTWQRQPLPIPDTQQLWHSSLLSSEGVAIAVGQAGIMVLSKNGGQTWRILETQSVAKDDLYGTFASEHFGVLFVVGKAGQLLRSQDNGDSWQKIKLATKESLRYLSMEPKKNALICTGENNTLLRSKDAGLSWTAIKTPAKGELRGMIIEPHTNNIIIPGTDGTIIRSEDAGLTWHMLSSHTQKHLRMATFNQKTGDFVAVGERIVHFKKQSPTINPP